MSLTKIAIAACASIALSSCSEEPAAPAAPAAPATLPAGLYEISSEVTKLTASDKAAPATKLKQGAKSTMQACVAADGTPDMAMFVESGDNCAATNSYARSGRISIQYQCARKGHGNLYPAADGNFTADGFEAVVNASTAFPGEGDYNLTRRLTAKRTGECPAGGAPKA